MAITSEDPFKVRVCVQTKKKKNTAPTSEDPSKGRGLCPNKKEKEHMALKSEDPFKVRVCVQTKRNKTRHPPPRTPPRVGVCILKKGTHGNHIRGPLQSQGLCPNKIKNTAPTSEDPSKGRGLCPKKRKTWHSHPRTPLKNGTHLRGPIQGSGFVSENTSSMRRPPGFTCDPEAPRWTLREGLYLPAYTHCLGSRARGLSIRTKVDPRQTLRDVHTIACSATSACRSLHANRRSVHPHTRPSSLH
jgi:hypothetical protein